MIVLGLLMCGKVRLRRTFDRGNLMTRRMGSPRHVRNRRRRTREGPEPACVQTPFPVRRKGGRAGLPARVSGTHVVRGRQSSPILEVRPGEQARLVKTVNIQVRWAEAQPGQDRRLPSVATHSRLQRATTVRSGVGFVLEDGSGVAIDWVTSGSYSSARRRLNVQSGQRKGGKCAAASYPSVAVRDRGH